MNLKHALIGVVAIVILGIFFGGRFSKEDPPPNEPTSGPTATAVEPIGEPSHQEHDAVHPEHVEPEEGVHGEDEQVVETPLHEGHDEHGPIEDPVLEAAAQRTTELFIDGWLNSDAAQRTTQLQPVGAEGLVEQLAKPDVRTWNTQPAGPPAVVELLDTTALVRQAFVDGRSVDLLLLAEPSAPQGWIVSDIQPAHA